MDGLGIFFEGLRDDEVLLFTTFTLDEAVLVALLDKYHAPKEQKIVVFHDIMRHRCPGILKSYYPNAMVYTVELTQSHPQRCPVFHSKIWARLANNTINKLIITSANLSQFHLVGRDGSGTLESFQYLDALRISSVSGGEIFNPKLLFPKPQLLSKGLHRIKMKPHSLVIDARKRVNIRVADEPLIEYLKELGTPELCAAPFVCDGAIRKHLGPSGTFWVYQGDHIKSRLSLHAKVMVFPNCLALGSVNWTAQAMGCMGKPINHETLLITRRDDAIIKQLLGFASRELSNTGIEVPGDQDKDEVISDWLAERSERIEAPEQALLSIENSRASIALKGKYKKVGLVRLQNVDSDAGLLVKISKDVIYEPVGESDRKAFASIIASGSVVLHGLKNASSQPFWETELNYQHFWPAFEENKQSGSTAKSNGGGSSPKDKKEIHFSDVRDIRQRVLSNTDRAAGFVTLNQWLSQNGVGGVTIPNWCLKLAELINKGRS